MKALRRSVCVAKRMSAICSAATILATTLAVASALTAADEIQGSIARGGKLYDKWYAVLDQKDPAEKHPLYPAASKYADQSSTTWRCKECHGWDYKGKDGAYAKGNHYTGIKGLQAMAGADPAKVVALLKDNEHGYGNKMSDQDLMDLANFVSKGQVDMDKYIDRSSKMPKNGNETRGADYFDTLCAQCHGHKGTEPDEMKKTLAQQMSDPWEVMHKLLNGQPDEKMPALRALDRKVVVDIMTYLTTLPKKK
jgi:cytochrome c553